MHTIFLLTLQQQQQHQLPWLHPQSV